MAATRSQMALTGSPRRRAMTPSAPAPATATRAQPSAARGVRGAIGRSRGEVMAAKLDSGGGRVNAHPGSPDPSIRLVFGTHSPPPPVRHALRLLSLLPLALFACQ